MIEVIPYEAHHVALMTPQPAQAHEALVAGAPDPRHQLDSMTVTADGLPVCCVGLWELWPGRASCWALFAADAGPHMVGVVRAIRFRLERAACARIEMVVDASFEPGRRLALMLGFEQETAAPLRKYLPGGRDAWLFARIT
jgi:hypothetical protein